ncbi:TonB-dependent copper receptor [Bordetella trematum]|uniref:TonB-dependent copper receptor n=1 Tax=Bordetella trematum TaxID=123899 RepID=UPI00140EA29E|nr:TonB-dependent copper receptor [Bordetella trematum]QIM72635.1 TonB-dependent copper receptor [Bordetella trematum]
MSLPYFPARASSLAAALCYVFSAPAQSGQPPAVSLPVADMDPVVITAIAPSSPLTIVTDPKLPRQPLPASDGADYLKTIPGFSAIRNGGSNGDPVLRGMFGSRLNILIDGGSMPGACPARMDAPTSYISPETFDRLTVIKGPQTVLWGPGASAGTIRFDREAPHFEEPGVRFDGSLTGGSFGRNDQMLDLTAGNGKVYTRITANHSHSQDYKDGDGNKVPSRWDKWNADFALGFTPDADTLYELTAGTGDGNARYAGRGMDGERFKRESFGLRLEKQHLSDTLSKLEAQLYYNHADHVMDNFSLRSPDPHSAMPMGMAANVDRATWGGRVAATWTLSPELELITGLDFQQSRHRSRNGTQHHSYRKQRWVKDADFGNTGVFSELTWRLDEDRRVVGGARIDRAQAKDFRPTTGGMMHARPNPTHDERRRDTLPSGFLRYEQDLQAAPVQWYVGLGHVERFPDYWELFSPGTGPDGAVNAFKGVKPEKTTQLDFGAQYRDERLQAWFSGYAGKVSDYILFKYRSGGMMGSTSQATNVDARIFGGEMGASYRFTPQWTAGATLAYAWARNTSDGRPLPQIPPLEARLTATYDDGTWSAGALWRLVAAQHRYARNEGNVVGKDFGPSAGFGVFSLNAGYAVSKQLKLSVGVDNLFNKTYAEHLNLAGNAGFGYSGRTAVNDPGRTLWARVNVKF